MPYLCYHSTKSFHIEIVHRHSNIHAYDYLKKTIFRATETEDVTKYRRKIETELQFRLIGKSTTENIFLIAMCHDDRSLNYRGRFVPYIEPSIYTVTSELKTVHLDLIPITYMTLEHDKPYFTYTLYTKYVENFNLSQHIINISNIDQEWVNLSTNNNLINIKTEDNIVYLESEMYVYSNSRMIVHTPAHFTAPTGHRLLLAPIDPSNDWIVSHNVIENDANIFMTFINFTSERILIKKGTPICRTFILEYIDLMPNKIEDKLSYYEKVNSPIPLEKRDI